MKNIKFLVSYALVSLMFEGSQKAVAMERKAMFEDYLQQDDRAKYLRATQSQKNMIRENILIEYTSKEGISFISGYFNVEKEVNIDDFMNQFIAVCSNEPIEPNSNPKISAFIRKFIDISVGKILKTIQNNEQ